jgi:hypothetical protein
MFVGSARSDLTAVALIEKVPDDQRTAEQTRDQGSHNRSTSNAPPLPDPLPTLGHRLPGEVDIGLGTTHTLDNRSERLARLVLVGRSRLGHRVASSAAARARRA